jgi:hypothetical protein
MSNPLTQNPFVSKIESIPLKREVLLTSVGVAYPRRKDSPTQSNSLVEIYAPAFYAIYFHRSISFFYAPPLIFRAGLPAAPSLTDSEPAARQTWAA